MNRNQFINEIKDNIEDTVLKSFFITFVEQCFPNYFFEIPASSTGNYHPKLSLGKGGLVRHTLLAIDIAIKLSNAERFTRMELDIAIVALAIHDSFKLGIDRGSYTVKEHPLIVREILNSRVDKFKKFKNNYNIKKVIKCVESHMGKYNYGGITPLPSDELELFVHKCDLLASGKFYDKYYKEVSDYGN